MSRRTRARALWMLSGLIGAVAMAACARHEPPGASTASGNSDGDGAAPLTAIRYRDHIQAGGVPPPAGELKSPNASGPEAIKSGESLFGSMNCDGCHGGGGSGWVGPSLADGRWRYGGQDDEIFNSIFYGRPKGMPAYGGAIGREGIWMLISYLKSLPRPDAVPTQSWIEPQAMSPQPDRNAETSVPPAAPQITAVKLTAAADPATLPQRSGCTACHAVDHKVVGPAFQDIAAKYRGQKNAAQKLFGSAKNGSVGVWGAVPMPPNASVPDADLHAIVKWILALKQVRSTP